MAFLVIFEKGIGLVETLRNSNIVAFVGGGDQPAFPPNKVILWDDATASNIAEIQCPSLICGIKLQLDK
jgi:WD repeat-containing protein 45